MKMALFLLPLTALAALAATEQQLNQRFTAQPEGQLVVDVDFGSIEVTAPEVEEVVVDVWREITRKNKADEEALLEDPPVTFSQDGNTITVRSRRNGVGGRSGGGRSRMQGRYTITVPAQSDAQPKTSAGSTRRKNP